MAVITQAESVNGTAVILVTAQDTAYTKTYTISFSLPTGIKDDIESELKIDMQNHTVFIRSSGDISYLQVSDIQGKLLLDKQIGSTETSLDIDNWKSGIYILKISTQNRVITKKISVTK